jgi:O-antigen ligase
MARIGQRTKKVYGNTAKTPAGDISRLANNTIVTKNSSAMKTIETRLAVSTHEGRGKKALLLAAILTFIGAVAYFTAHDQIVFLIAGGVVLIAGYFLFKWPEFATLVFVFILYANLAVVAVQFHHVPQIAAAGVSGLLMLPLANYLFRRQERLFFNFGFLLILIYFAALVTSTILANDVLWALDNVGNFLVEGLILYFLFINVIRELQTLKRTIWTLLLAGSMLGGLSVFQEATHTYDNSYGGLAQKSDELDMEQVDFSKYGGSRRAGGPIGKENRYAQIMVVIFPLALGMFYVAPSRKQKFLALVAAGLILGGIILTFSRGAFVTLAGMMMIIVFLRYIKPVQALGGIALLVLVIVVALPEYVDRVSTVANLSGIASGNDQAREADGSLRGRFAENLAAIRVFIEHPLLGVGPGQFAKFYSMRYGNEVGTKKLISNRRAHSLYFEMAADMGVVGLTTFMIIAFTTARRLWQARRRFSQTRPELAHLATAILLGIFGYFGTATFLHLSYQRYYWFLMALAGAALHVFSKETAQDASVPVQNSERQTEVQAHDATV